MNKIAAPLKIIANFITQNHAQKCTFTIKNSILTPQNAQEMTEFDVFSSLSKRPTLC